MELVQLFADQRTGHDGDARSVADVLGGGRGEAVTVAGIDVDVLVGVADDPEPCGSRFQTLNILLCPQLSCVHSGRCHAQNI